MIKFWQRYGGWSVWLFIVSLPPQFVNNFLEGKYMSGSITTWALLAVAYLLFGTYTLLKKDYVVTVGQYIGGAFSLIIVVQYFVYPHAG